MQKWKKPEIKPGRCSGFFPPMPLQCPSFDTVLCRNSTKGGALAFKIQTVGGAGFSWQKRLHLRARLR